jgi:2-polyprenyl-3-methyl-5-hydroxy-6-metoxy-1,4-benzoquinol methylase
MLRAFMTHDPNFISKKRTLKTFARSLLSLAKLNIRFAVTPGVSFWGLNVFIDKRPGPLKPYAMYALDYALKLNPKSVLDVGSGGGGHAKVFRESGSKVLCVDYGTSIYAKESTVEGLNVIHIDFNAFEPTEKFDLVWASHVLEHQRNVGSFIERLVACCSDSGHVCITLPDPHRNLWGGHLSIWSPGLLAYNIVLCGIDLSNAVFVRGSNEFSIFFKPVKIQLPDDLTYDNGDLNKLSGCLPQSLAENTDPWKVSYERALSIWPDHTK